MCATSQRRRHSRWRMLFLLICILGHISHSESLPTYPGKNTEARGSPPSLSSASSTRRTEEVGLPSELAWQAWLLVDPHSGTHSDLDSSSLLRRITPKSVFIAPVLPACADGYRADTMGRCVKNVNIDHQAHLDFIVKRLNAMYANVAANSAALTNSGQSQKQSSGPLQLNIPLVSSSNTHSTRIEHDQRVEQEQIKLEREQDRDRNLMSLPIPMPQRNTGETNKRKAEDVFSKISIRENSANLDDVEPFVPVRNHSSSPPKNIQRNDGPPANLVIAIGEFYTNDSSPAASVKEDLDHEDIDSLELPSESLERFTDKRKPEKMIATKNYNVYEIKNDTNFEEEEDEEEIKFSNRNNSSSSEDLLQEDDLEQRDENFATRTEPTVTTVTESNEFYEESTTSATSFPDSTESVQEQTEGSTELLITVTTPREVERFGERKDLEDTTIADELKNEADLEEVETTFSLVNNSNSSHVPGNRISQTRSDPFRNLERLDDETTTSLPESTWTEQTTEMSTTPLPETIKYFLNRNAQDDVTTENYPTGSDSAEEDERADSFESNSDLSIHVSHEERRNEQRRNQERQDSRNSQPQFVGIRVLEIIENANNTNFSGIVDYKIPTDVEAY